VLKTNVKYFPNYNINQWRLYCSFKSVFIQNYNKVHKTSYCEEIFIPNFQQLNNSVDRLFNNKYIQYEYNEGDVIYIQSYVDFVEFVNINNENIVYYEKCNLPLIKGHEIFF
jgi:hypothetical protein